MKLHAPGWMQANVDMNPDSYLQLGLAGVFMLALPMALSFLDTLTQSVASWSTGAD
jgi:hypothetical protein